MITAMVLLNVERGRVNEVAERLADLAGITEVFSVAGRYDLVAILRVKTNEELADLVTEMRPLKHYYEAGVPARRGIEW